MFNIKNINKSTLFLLFVYLFLLQGMLNSTIEVFSYVDEIIAILCIVLTLISIIVNKKIKIKKRVIHELFPLVVFVLIGLLGNCLFHYQPIQYVLTDLLTNLKFFLVIGTAYFMFQIPLNDSGKKRVSKHIKVISSCLFILFLLDRIFHVFPILEVRYGIYPSYLMFGHPTYLAGTMIFLITTLTLFYSRKSNIYLIMDLIILVFTLRGKAIGGALAYVLIFFFVIIFKKKFKLKHFIMIGVCGILIAWSQISFYYISLSGKSARSVLTITSVEIAKDYFPIGTGFGTYGSNVAGIHYSPVYEKYGFNNVYELSKYSKRTFFDDTFWPIIIGQTGIIGTICYLVVLMNILKRILKLKYINSNIYASGIFIFIYLLISSMAEPAFNNSIAIPLAFILGYAFKEYDLINDRRDLIENING